MHIVQICALIPPKERFVYKNRQILFLMRPFRMSKSQSDVLQCLMCVCVELASAGAKA